MKVVIAVFVVVGGLVFGAKLASASLPTALVWGFGGGGAAVATVGVTRILCRNGTILELTDRTISFIKPNGDRWGPYNRT